MTSINAYQLYRGVDISTGEVIYISPSNNRSRSSRWYEQSVLNLINIIQLFTDDCALS